MVKHPRRTKKETGRSTKQRASWRGLLSFGLVSIQVEAFNALNREGSDIHFHQIHAKCHRRIQYQKVCPVHGEVPNDEIVSGYEVTKNHYVEVTHEELDALRTEKDRALKIDAFISPGTVDPLYFDGRMYYLLPAVPEARSAYAIMVGAMEREERYGVGQLVFSGKDQIALIRPLDGILHMAMLNYEAEIRSPSKLARELGAPKEKAGELRMAQRLVEEWSDDQFDFSKYHDTHREMVKELLASKRRGHEIEPPAEEEEPETLDLMDALKQSLAIANHGRTTRRRRALKRTA